MPKIDLTPTPAGVEEFARTAQAMSGRRISSRVTANAVRAGQPAPHSFKRALQEGRRGATQ